jgi:hypothetical protein
MPETLQEWEDMKSKKLEALVKVIQYHLAADGLPPMSVVDNDVTPPVDAQPTPQEDSRPDKIVVYCAFPSNNEFVKAVSDAY